MKKNVYYGSIDLTLVGQIAKQQENLIRKKTLKDGVEHKFINISILIDDENKEDEFGNIGAVKVDCKQEEQKQQLKYWVGNLKKSKFANQQQPQPAPQTAPRPRQQPTQGNFFTQPADDGLPF